MTREQIQQEIDVLLDSIAFDEDGNGRTGDGRIATDADFKRAWDELIRLKELLRAIP